MKKNIVIIILTIAVVSLLFYNYKISRSSNSKDDIIFLVEEDLKTVSNLMEYCKPTNAIDNLDSYNKYTKVLSLQVLELNFNEDSQKIKLKN